MSAPRRIRRRTTALTLAALAATSAVLVACGSEAQIATTTIAPDPLARPLVAALDEPPALDEADLAAALLARAGALAATDFATGWTTELDAGDGASGPGTCSASGGVAQRGATMGLTEAPAHVTSAAHVFPDEATAQRWIEQVRAPEWATCRARSFDGVLTARASQVRVEVGDRAHPQLGTNGFEAFTELRGVDPESDLAFVVHVLHHRRGRVVLESTLERSIELSDAQWSAVDDAHAAALATAWTRLSAVEP